MCEEKTPVTESMKDYEKELEQSFTKIKEGDLLSGTVAGITDTEVTVDLGLYSDGIIPLQELSNDPKFSIKGDITVGEPIKAVVLSEDNGEGHILLSKKQADDILAWDDLKELMDQGTVLTLKIGGVVNGGVITYVHGIRGFIPASHLALSYVEDLNTYLNQTVEAKIITVDASKKRLVLSVREVLRDQKAQENRKNLPVFRLVTSWKARLKILLAMVHLSIWVKVFLALSTFPRSARSVFNPFTKYSKKAIRLK